MSDMASTCRYEIRVDGVLDTRWETWFEGLHIATTAATPPSPGRWPIRPPCTEY